MIYGKQALTLAFLMASSHAAVADSMTYHNDRFGVQGRLPVGWMAADPPANGDGRSFEVPAGSGRITIYGSHNFLGDFETYRFDYKEFYNSDISWNEEQENITYEASGADWFVLSGYSHGTICYLRVEAGKTCDGTEVLGHWLIEYPTEDRAMYDDQIGFLSKGLEVASC